MHEKIFPDEIQLTVSQFLTWNSATLFLLLAFSRRVVEPVTKILYAWSWSQSLKFEFRLHNPAPQAS